MPTVWKCPLDPPVNKVVLPTIDTLHNSLIWQTAIQGKKNVMLIGAPGKTAFLKNTILTAVDANTASLTVDLSSSTSGNKI